MMAVTKSRKPASAYHHGDLRTALVRAGLEQLEDHGTAGLSLRRVAAAAGVSAAAPYAHFTDKAALLAAIAAEGFVAFRKALETARTKNPAGLEAMAVAYVLFARRNPALFRLMFGPELADLSPHPDLRQKAAASFAVLQQAVATVTSARSSASEDRATAAWGLVHGLATLVLDGRIAAGASEAELTRRVRAAVRTGGLGG